ncbi:hypothetical protein THASP1DRAFT_27417 [Thamnocephalis sphaerospora]|uniref:Uncharacterized protein n=1 Tax=Thamnocephalis sphaerospora TaxID=78915 RepID=A0A4P9XYP2_9FUNG|nr:hypothetical protein THASP1DRAFT_27417 [Thamnocephalis sphaerospora]|eukprot:RKP10821.1 hypothetical protein THASP1DRAFT_27417 [Thamnocephalis sphaerospora]
MATPDPSVVADNVRKLKEKLLKTGQLITLYQRTDAELKLAEEKLARASTTSDASVKKLKEDLEIARKESLHRQKKWQETAVQARKAGEEAAIQRRKAEDLSMRTENKRLRERLADAESRAVPPGEEISAEILVLQGAVEQRETRCQQLEARIRALTKRAQDAEADAKALRHRQAKKGKNTADASKAPAVPPPEDAEQSDAVRHAVAEAEELRDKLTSTQRVLQAAQRRAQEAERGRTALQNELTALQRSDALASAEQSAAAVRQMAAEEQRRAQNDLDNERRRVQELRQEVAALQRALAATASGAASTPARHSDTESRIRSQASYWRAESEKLAREKRALQDLVTKQYVEIIDVREELQQARASALGIAPATAWTGTSPASSLAMSLSSPQIGYDGLALDRIPADLEPESMDMDFTTRSTHRLDAAVTTRARPSAVLSPEATLGNDQTRPRRTSDVPTSPRKRARTVREPVNAATPYRDSSTSVDATLTTVPPVGSARPARETAERILAHEQDDMDYLTYVFGEMEERPSALRDLLAPLRPTVNERPDAILAALEKYWRGMRTHFFQPVDLDSNPVRRLKPIDQLPVCVMPSVASAREANAILLVWVMHHQWPAANLLNVVLAKFSSKLVLELGDEQHLSYACRVVRFLGVLLRNSGDIQRARVLGYDLLHEQVMGDNLMPLLENLAKAWPDIFQGKDNRMLPLLQSIVAGLETYTLELPKFAAMKPNIFMRMWKSFETLCGWPAHDDAPFLDKVCGALHSEQQALPETENERQYEIKMALELASFYLPSEDDVDANDEETTAETNQAAVDTSAVDAEECNQASATDAEEREKATTAPAPTAGSALADGSAETGTESEAENEAEGDNDADENPMTDQDVGDTGNDKEDDKEEDALSEPVVPASSSTAPASTSKQAPVSKVKAAVVAEGSDDRRRSLRSRGGKPA